MKLQKKICNEKIIAACLLVISFTIFSLFYIRSVVMPQNGWWQYFAYRMTQGDVLYKDVYLFIPPYFAFLTRILYSFFSNNFLFYILFIGYPIKISCLLILYYILSRIVRPFYASISVLVSACIGATYFMDVWYDYNPVLMLPCLLVSYFIMRVYEEKSIKKKNVYCLLSGVLTAVLLMSKQTLGITYGCVVIIMIVVLYCREKIFKKIIPSLLGFLFGFLIGLIPAIVYFTKFSCWNDFYKCMNMATGAKGGMFGIFDHLVKTMGNVKSWIIAILFVILSSLLQYCKGKKISVGRKIAIYITGIMMILQIAFVFSEYIKDFIMYFEGPKKRVALVVCVLLIVLLIFIEYNYALIKKYPILAFVGYYIAINLLFWLTSKLSVDFLGYTYNTLNLFGVRRQWLIVLTYVFVLLYFKQLILYFVKYDAQKDYSVLMFTTLIVVHFFTGIISASSIEELFVVLYIPWVIAEVFKLKTRFSKYKNMILAIICSIIMVSCLICKLLIPYDWQGWRQLSITKNMVSSDIEGLTGYKLTEETEKQMSTIIELIEENTNDEDGVYQFANIPLFNVLTERKIPVYGVISWFDVCPDEVAEKNAEMLMEENPKVIIWHNMSEDEWRLLENVFRNGEASGQRKIKEFYDTVVQKKYRMVYEIYNNREGTIQVWIKNN